MVHNISCDLRLWDHGIELRVLGGDVVQELGVVRDHTPVDAQAALLAQQTVAQVNIQVVQREHAHVPDDSFDPRCDTGLRHHFVEQVVGTVEGPLPVDCRVETVGVDKITQRAFEVGRQLTGVVASGPPTYSISLDQHHCGRRVAQREEGSGDTGDSGTDDRDIGRAVDIKGPWQRIGIELFEPRRPTRDRVPLRCNHGGILSDRRALPAGSAQARSTEIAAG